jgi:hypothetical protein
MGFNLADYEPVEDRLREFWKDHPAGRVVTELLKHDGADYIVKAAIYRGDELRDGLPAATGLAHDSYDQLPQQMKVSALETCETSAIGRALANLGYAPKGKRPSREEMEKSRSGASGKGKPGRGTTAGGGGDGEAPAPPAPSSSAVVTTGVLPIAEDHTHDWKPSPRKSMADRGWKVCAQPGCGETRKQ